VALKFCVDETAASSLRKEVELLDRVSRQGRHRGIVELRYAHLEGNPPCLEYEYVDGGDLAGLVTDMHRSGKATPLNMARLFYSLVQAVGFAHRIQPPIVHRDLKPTNVLTTRVEKRVALKVLDFGIGGLAADQERLAAAETGRQGGTLTTSAGTCTPLYASPQQRCGAGPDPRDDVYALGVIWYQMLVGDVMKEPPRGGSWKKRLLERGTTPKMLALLERCLEDDPADRPADAQVLAQELEAIVKEAAPPGPVPVPPGLPPVPQRPPARAQTRPAAVATMLDRAPTKSSEGRRQHAKRWKWILAGFGLVCAVVLAWSLWRVITPRRTADQSPHASLRVLNLSVKYFAKVDGNFHRPQGVLGKDSFNAYCDDSVTLESTLSRPAYAYLISFRPDGSEELLFPEDENEAPGLTDVPRYPSKSRGVNCGLNEGAGLQVFALVATSQPLPAYTTWRKKCGRSPWSKYAATPGGVWSDGSAAVEGSSQRGKGLEVKGKTEVASLADWLRAVPGVETVSAVGFSVLPKEKAVSKE
jgi:serine/threonine protein kinase